jgi:hypothetical protein
MISSRGSLALAALLAAALVAPGAEAFVPAKFNTPGTFHFSVLDFGFWVILSLRLGHYLYQVQVVILPRPRVSFLYGR